MTVTNSTPFTAHSPSASPKCKLLPKSRGNSIRSRFLNRIYKVSPEHRSMPVAVRAARSLSQLQQSYALRGYQFPSCSASERLSVVSPPPSNSKWVDSRGTGVFLEKGNMNNTIVNTTPKVLENCLAKPFVTPEHHLPEDSDMDVSTDEQQFVLSNDLALPVSPIKPSRTRRVRFAQRVSVAEIPSFRCYNAQEKATMWTSMLDLRLQARRNTVEWLYEGCDMERVVEEEGFLENLHPAHFQHFASRLY